MGLALSVDLRAARALARSMRMLEPEIGRTIRKDLRGKVRSIIPRARARFRKRTGRAAGSITVTSKGLLPALRGGGARAPYFGWIEFGGGIPSARSPVRSNPMRGYRFLPIVREGRYLTPTAIEEADRVGAEMGDSLSRAIERTLS